MLGFATAEDLNSLRHHVGHIENVLRKVCEEVEALQRLCEVDKVRPIFLIGPVSEIRGNVEKTPQFHSFPIVGEIIVNLQITDSQQVNFTVGGFLDKKGQPAKAPAGTASFAVDNTDLLAITPSADNMSCLVKAVGPLGSGVVSWKIADPDGNALVAASAGIDVISGAPVTAVLTPDTPAEQP